MYSLDENEGDKKLFAEAFTVDDVEGLVFNLATDYLETMLLYRL